jgi:pyrroloquinoline quinone biosynthesis protein D
MANITPTMRPRLMAHARLQWDSVREKQVLLAPEEILVLNETAAAILGLCDGDRSVSAIAAELGSQYGRDVEQDIVAFLNRLVGKGLVQCDESIE